MSYELFIRNCLSEYFNPDDIVILEERGDFDKLYPGLKEKVERRINAIVNQNGLFVIEYDDERFFRLDAILYIYNINNNIYIRDKSSFAYCYYCKKTSDLFCYVDYTVLENCLEAFPGWF